MPKKSFINDTLNYLKQSYGQDTLKKTMHYQQKYGFEVNPDPSKRTHNNEGDAFKHAFMSADLMINNKFPFTAEQIANIHEWQGNKFYGQPAGEENMDKWNNWQGRDIAEHLKQDIPPEQLKELIRTGKIDDVIAEKVYERMKAGKLITNPNDSRNYEKTYGKDSPYSKDKKIYTFEEIKKMKPEEFRKNQAKILADFTSGKMMHEDEAKEKVKSGEIHVNSYTRQDGTKVSDYYRRK